MQNVYNAFEFNYVDTSNLIFNVCIFILLFTPDKSQVKKTWQNQNNLYLLAIDTIYFI